MAKKKEPDVWQIFASIVDGVGGHGSFMTAFARAVVTADNENFELLKPVALELIKKYDLNQKVYL